MNEECQLNSDATLRAVVKEIVLEMLMAHRQPTALDDEIARLKRIMAEYYSVESEGHNA